MEFPAAQIMKSGFYYTNPERKNPIKMIKILFKGIFTIKWPKNAIIIITRIFGFFRVFGMSCAPAGWLAGWLADWLAGWLSSPRAPSGLPQTNIHTYMHTYVRTYVHTCKNTVDFGVAQNKFSHCLHEATDACYQFPHKI